MSDVDEFFSQPRGFVTLPRSGQEWATANSISRLGDRSLPVRHRFGSEFPQGRSGDEMALQVEGVVDSGMDAEKPLCGAGRFEPLHFPLPPSHNLVRFLGTLVGSSPDSPLEGGGFEPS